MSGYQKPEICEVHKLLEKHDALIVHFSGTPKGAGSDFDYNFPGDLRKVAEGSAITGISCSVVTPRDQFACLEKANATGCIGVIVGLSAPDSLVAASPGDCGSYMVEGKRVVIEQNLNLSGLNDTIINREADSYNEWVIRTPVVVGIFAAPPYRISVNSVPEYPEEMPDYLKDGNPTPNFEYLSEAEIFRAFPDQKIFFAIDGKLVERTEDGETEFNYEILNQTK